MTPRPGDSLPGRSGGAASGGGVGTGDGTPQGADPTAADASALVAATPPRAAPIPPARPVISTTDDEMESRSVARSSAAGERTIGAAAPTSSTGPVTPGTAAVKPRRPAERPRVERQKPTRRLLPGDLVCGECGEGNPPSRKFCSRCGASLSDATVATTPWWRALIPKRRGKKMAAGERRWKNSDGSKRRTGVAARAMRVFAKVRPLAAVVLLVVGLVYGVSPDLRDNVNTRVGSARDRFMDWVRPTYGPISPIDVSVTSDLADDDGRAAVDSNTLTTWFADPADEEPTLVARFDGPIDLERITLWNGAPDGFKDHHRIRRLHLVFDTGATDDVEIDDLPDAVDYDVDNGQGIREVEVHVVEIHGSLSGESVALSEIEFLVKR